MSYPFPGWNEGFTTSAPLVYLALKGQNVLPVQESLILDMVPVDHIAAGMIMVAAQACVEQPKLVHQLSSGDLNPSRIGRVTTLTGLYKRKRFQNKETGNKFINALAARMEFRPVTYEEYDRRSHPAGQAAGRPAVARRWTRSGRAGAAGASRRSSIGSRTRSTTSSGSPTRPTATSICSCPSSTTTPTSSAPTTSAPCATGCRPSEQAEVDLVARDASTGTTTFSTSTSPACRSGCCPSWTRPTPPSPRRVYAYRDLLELFDTTTKLHATRIAMRIERGKREEIYSYENLQELATRVGTFLVGEGVAAGDRVMLFAKNAPEWAMAYFGILKAGATVVPIAHESTWPRWSTWPGPRAPSA